MRRVPLGFGLMYVAGVLSGLLGIGSGAVKVLAMDQAMKIPFKVSTTTSNFMIGVTAAASAGIYLRNGYIDPGLAMPVMLGVLLGALTGARVLPGAKVRTLRLVFAVVIAALAVEMILQGRTREHVNERERGGAAAGVTSDKAIEMWLGKLLRSGVILAALVVFAGGVWYVAQATGTVGELQDVSRRAGGADGT